MIKKREFNEILEGQISIFDLELNFSQKPKKENIPVVKSHRDKFAEIINLYQSSAARIVKQVCGSLLVELDDKTLYFNGDGVKELELRKDMALLPGDEILVVNQDRELNELQLQRLKALNVTEYIKRKGDANIIIQEKGKTIVISPKGWILEYVQAPKYKENEVFSTKIHNENTDSNNKITESDEDHIEFNLDDTVEIEYEGSKEIGKIKSIYNNGETINVSWNGKRTAFYYKCVRKVS
ncbi:hypothetical protein HMT_16 [Clostridium phage HM T]|uniref:Uncharacterized protein n=1 Tax=Clostridium saccharoperbutylacetonicum N1-4(HMT) TaxID=931276 RepID=M1LPL6_9CLOT|nr:hypothetical protein [Clostridium saccharoperbutylacetonicum]AMB17428.1 hypothetical protein HMT_16 [Clostridium phage HM T]AGF54780.1 hypothetical protein Cspa_c10040 [Clostridium saccharoperbutylacetonicum N1-4(HMT)]NRT58699.1 hypothetical protein [Clostridium saccharoperbutylacetonicum]NSB27888.1 hypothetical protein [Clostridium saccharoperbutylacetonicum]NSB41371.1 hypothetical protein [Clostridium saccharoperbutylacetonicum]